jgi:predicted PurR-regulated permease PerM
MGAALAASATPAAAGGGWHHSYGWGVAAGVGAAAILCALILEPFLPAIVWSFALAVLFTPLYTWMRKLLPGKGLAAAASVAIVAGVVVVPAIIVLGILLNEVAGSAPRLMPLLDAQNWTRAIDHYPRLAPAIHSAVERLNIPNLLQAASAWLAGWSGSFVQGSVSSLITLLLTFYFLFYALRDREMAVAAIGRVLPLTAAEYRRLTDRITNTIFASVYGTAAVATLQGVLGGAMFWWLDLPAPLFWGVLMGLLSIVPFQGAFVIWAPAAIVLWLNGDLPSAILLTLWGTLVVGLMDDVLYPMLVGRRLMLHTVLSFIAVVGGLLFFGAPGIILGPIIVAGAQTLLEIWRRRNVASA